MLLFNPLMFALAVLAPIPKNDTWVDKIVMGKMDQVRGNRTEPDGEIKILNNLDYRVVKETKELLALADAGGLTWVKKKDFLLLNNAPAYFDQLQKDQPEMAKESWVFAFRGWAYHRIGEWEKGLGDYAQAIKLKPEVYSWHSNRGLIYNAAKKYEEAVTDFNNALKLWDGSLTARSSRAFALSKLGRYEEAVNDYKLVVERAPEIAGFNNGLAWLLATCPEAKFRDGKKAVALSLKANELTKNKVGTYLDALAAAYAEAGDFEQAVKWQQTALEDPDFVRDEKTKKGANARLQMYKDKKPYRLGQAEDE